MNTALIIIGLSMLIFVIVFYLKRTQEKRKARDEEERITELKYQTEKDKIKGKMTWKGLRIAALSSLGLSWLPGI